MSMRRLLPLVVVSLLMAIGCEPDTPEQDIPNDPIENPDDNPTPEPEPEPEPEPTPDDAISTLEGDLLLDFNTECSMCYADCFGDYYKTGLYMWCFYFQNYTTKEQLYIEVMHPDQLYEVPQSEFTASDNIYREYALLKGTYDFEGYQAYSWYTSLATSEHDAHIAPIVEGTMSIRLIEETGNHEVKFDLKDDAGNAITGVYSHRVVLEDFRI